jgi:hypothetical protein
MKYSILNLKNSSKNSVYIIYIQIFLILQFIFYKNRMKFKHFSEFSNNLNYINLIYLIKFKIKFLKMK